VNINVSFVIVKGFILLVEGVDLGIFFHKGLSNLFCKANPWMVDGLFNIQSLSPILAGSFLYKI
jgi:hypothetical protein